MLKLTYSRLLKLIESIFYPFQLNYNFLNIRIEPALDYFVEMTAVLPNELLISQQARDLGNQLIKEMKEGGYGYHIIWKNIDHLFTPENVEWIQQQLSVVF